MQPKQKFVFVLVLAISTVITTLFARQIFSRQEIQVSYTAGFEEVPAIHVAIIVLNFASLGYIERADKRTHLALTGQVSLSSAKQASFIDMALSCLAAVGLITFSRRMARKFANDG